MTGSFSNLMSRAVRTAWTVINDFTPKRTMMEVGFYLDARRNGFFNAKDQAMVTRLQAHLDAARALHAAAIQSQASSAVVVRTHEQVAVLESLLSPVDPYRDVLSGSLSSAQEADSTWRATSELPATTAFLVERGRDLGARLFENRDLRDNSTRLKSQIQVQKQMVLQARVQAVSVAEAQAMDARLQALNVAEQAIAGIGPA